MPIRRKKVSTHAKPVKELRLSSLKKSLELCNQEIETLQKLSTEGFSTTEKLCLDRDLEVQKKTKQVLKEKLAILGFIEKRGRPKKSIDDMYSSNHVKFTAMLKPENISYLKQLKTDGKIENISSFIDSLIEDNRSNSQF